MAFVYLEGGIMGNSQRRRQFRRWLAWIGTTAVIGSAASVLAGTAAYATTDTITFTNGSPGEALEGQSITNQVVAHFTDSGNADITGQGFCAAANSSQRYTATINWGDSTSSVGSVACAPTGEVPTGVFDVTGTHVYADSGTYNIMVGVTDTTDEPHVTKSAQTDTAAISDVELGVDGDNSPDGPFRAAEGNGNVAIVVDFFDDNTAFPTEGAAFDSGITATVDWGDGSPIQAVTPTVPPSSCDCAGDAEVAATHSYDANEPTSATFTIKVTAKDDGGMQATDTLTAKISDAGLTADATQPGVSATATKAFTATVATFKDAAGAQAANADFTASINWGDNSTSNGTVTKTASGAFSVSGSHTYASAGSKSLTITATDEEGSMVSMHATATVAAAPVVLPATGQPHQPASAWPVALVALLLLGLVAMAGGVARFLLKRA
jgi:hypothetical protein